MISCHTIEHGRCANCGQTPAEIVDEIEASHRRSAPFKPEPICTGDCHSGSFRDFDHYCDSVDIRPDEVPAAFAAWLNATTGWDGAMERIE